MPTSQSSNICKTVARVFALVVMLACLSASGSVFADGASSAKQAARQALAQNGGSGEVLGVSTETDRSGNRVYAVKIINNGRVRVIRIPQD